MSTKFKPEQKVIIPNYMINGSRLDMPAVFKRYLHYTDKPDKVEVYLNTVYMIMDESRLVDYEDYTPSKKE